jgi:hypothetical protein
MSERSPRSSRRIASIVLVSAFGAFALAPPACASDVRRDTSANATVAPAPPLVHEFAVLQPHQSPTLIGLAIAQMVTQSIAAQSSTPPARQEAARLLPPPPARSRGLDALYASSVVLQALDIHSTLRATSGGGAEGNAIVAPFVSRPGAFVAIMAAGAVGAIVAADRLSKHNRVAAYALMFALNSAYTFVVVHNYRIARR